MVSSRLYSNEELEEFRSMAKRVTNPQARWVDKPGHQQRNFQVIGWSDETRFVVYQRQNLAEENDFSCGIAYSPPGGARLTLARYNGPSHIHGGIIYRPHIHHATASAIAAGKKPESEAVETDKFRTLDGAFRCLIDDFQLGGIAKPEPDSPRLFP